MSRILGGQPGSAYQISSGTAGGMRIMWSEVPPCKIIPPRSKLSDMAGKLITTLILDGQVSFTGGLSKTTTKLLDGSVSFVGTLLKTTNKILSGSVSFVGAMSHSVKKLLDGSVSFAGSAIKTMTRLVAGAVGFAGDVQLTDVPPSGGGGDPGNIITHPSKHAEPGSMT